MNLDAFEGVRRKMSLSTMSKPALIGIAAVLVMVAVVVAGRLFGAATTTDFQITKGGDIQESAVTHRASSSVSVSSSSANATLFVHVTGAVVSPGLYELETGARMADAVQAAGGFAGDAVPESVNLARPLSDGEQIIVSSRDEAAAASVDNRQYHADAESSEVAASSKGLVNINKADASELTTLPGVGEATARKIVDDRTENGGFKTIEDLKRVSGIGDKKFESIRDLICV